MKSWWQRFWPRIVAFLLAVVATTAAASLAHSLFVQAALREVGAVIPFGPALGAIIRDFFGLLPTLGPVVALALLLMHAVYGFSPLAGARTALGFLAISLSGVVGGIVFTLLRKRRLF